MICDDPMEYRAEGYLTVAIWEDEDVENMTYLVIEPEYEEQMKENEEMAKQNYRRFLTRLQLKVYLDKLLTGTSPYNFNLMMDFAWNFGGLNINKKTGAWKGFINLSTI